MLDNEKSSTTETRWSRFVLVLVSYGVYCGISWLSRSIYPLFVLVVLLGIGIPLAWGGYTRDWASLGFSRRRMGTGLLLGLAAGIVSGAAGLAVLRDRSIVRDLVQQLWIGIPFWFLIISPFQELFFRGWIQSGLEGVLGGWWGLIIANLGFTVWHYVSPIVDMSTIPLASPGGFTATFIAGLAYGYVFHRSQNVAAPWLGHAISGLIFVAFGAMDFVGAVR
jgi:membrane protease YdiL (CAAX protease family)